MAGLKGLKKTERKEDGQIDIEDFIAGAQKRVDALKPSSKRPRKYERYNFSLDAETSQLIDDLTLDRGFRVSRSDVVKASILMFSKATEFEINTFLKKVTKDFD